MAAFDPRTFVPGAAQPMNTAPGAQAYTAPVSYLNQLIPTSKASFDSGIKILVYGKAGVGKTRLIPTCPNPVIMSAENGTLSIRNHNIMKLPEIKTVDDFINQKRWWLESDESKQFFTLCIDSLSEIAQNVLHYELNTKKDGRAAYGAMNNAIIEAANEFRSSNRSYLIITQEEYDKDEQTGIWQSRPMLPGRTLTGEMPYKFDEMLQLITYPNPDPMQRPLNALRCWPTNEIVAKDRSGALAAFEQPDITAIFRKILGV